MAMLGLTSSSLVVPYQAFLLMVPLAHLFRTLDASSCRGFYNIGCKPFHTSVLNYVQPLLHTGLTHCMHPFHTGLSY